MRLTIDLDFLAVECRRIGLSLNPNECEVIHNFSDTELAQFTDFESVPLPMATL